MREGWLPFVVQTVPKDDGVTARAGLTLVRETMLALGMPQLCKAHLRIQERPGKHADFDKLADLVLMLAAGGECIDDVRLLAADSGLCRLLGRRPASAETLRDFLYRFHYGVSLRLRHVVFRRVSGAVHGCAPQLKADC